MPGFVALTVLSKPAALSLAVAAAPVRPTTDGTRFRPEVSA